MLLGWAGRGAVWPVTHDHYRRVSLSYGCDTAIKRVQFRMQAKCCGLVLFQVQSKP